MSIEVQYKTPRDSVLGRLIGGGKWCRWKKYETEKQAHQACDTLNKNHAWLGWKFRISPARSQEEGER